MYFISLKRSAFNLPLVLAMVVVMIFAVGCEKESEDIPTGPPTTVEGLVNEGWENYGLGNYSDALTNFADAANAEAENLEAYLGMGYTYAQLNELNRSLQNFEIVGALSVVLVNIGTITQAEADILNNESAAGKILANLVALNYETAIEVYAEAVDMGIVDGFDHRRIPSLDETGFMLLGAEAYFGNEQYAECMFIIDDLSPGFTSGPTIDIVEENGVAIGAGDLYEDTDATGIANLTLANSNLIYPEAVVDPNHGDTVCTIMEFDQSGNTVTFKANPSPALGDTYDVRYYYATDFGEFILALRNSLDTLGQ